MTSFLTMVIIPALLIGVSLMSLFIGVATSLGIAFDYAESKTSKLIQIAYIIFICVTISAATGYWAYKLIT